MRILAIDVGSSSVKAAVFAEGKPSAVVREDVPFEYDGVRAVTPAVGLLAAVERAARRAAEGAAVEAVALDTFSPGVVVLSPKGKLLAGCVTHQDRRSTAEGRELEERFGKTELLAATGNRPFPGGIGSTTLLWMKRHGGGILRKGMVGQPSSFLLWHWTRRWVIDPSQAAFLGLLDIRSGDWFEPGVRFLGLERGALPELVAADEVAGRVTREAARRLGVKPGTPVVGGCVDTSAAFFNTGLETGTLLHNSGSTDVLGLVLQRPRPADDLLTRPLGCGAVLPARWLAVSTIAAGGSAVEWAREAFFRELEREAFYGVFRGAVKLAERGAPTRLRFVPTLAGSRTAMEQGAGTIEGVTLSTTREGILAALARGLIEESARRYERLSQVQRIGETVFTTGGNAELGRAMRQAWPGRHKTRALAEANLTGLARMAGSLRRWAR